MNKKLERYRQLRDKKKARLEKAQKDMDRLEQMVQDEENTQIVAAVRSYSLTPEELEAFLKERRMIGASCGGAHSMSQRGVYGKERDNAG